MGVVVSGTGSGLVRVERPDERVALVRIADDEHHNAFTPELIDALLAALDAVDRDPATHAVVLAGGPDTFCSGASRGLLESLLRGTMRPTELGLASRLLDLSVPVVAACRGSAVGGGFALALAADLVVLADDRRYGFNFMDLGITPGMGTTSLSEHFLGPAMAHRMLLTGELLRGAELSRGAAPGALEAHPAARVEERALSLAARIADKPRLNLAMLKRSLTLRRRRAFLEATTLESLMHERSLGSLDLSAILEPR